MVTQDLALQGMSPVSVVGHLNYILRLIYLFPFFPLSPSHPFVLYFCHPSFPIAC